MTISKSRKIWGNIFLIAAGFFIIYLIVVMFYKTAAIVEKDDYITIFGYEMIIAIVLFFCAFSFRFKILHKLPKVLGWIIRIILLAFLIPVLCLFVMILSGSNAKADTKADYVIVLGATLEKGEMTKDLKYRLDTAIDYYLDNDCEKIIVSGGNAAAGSKSEASLMKEYLMENGIDESQIIVEDKSTSTRENFENIYELIGKDENAVVVSSGYHLKRVALIAEKVGFTKLQYQAAKADPLFLPTSYLWEMINYVNQLMK